MFGRFWLSAVVVFLLASPCWGSSTVDPALSLIYLTEEYKPYNYTEDGEQKGFALDLLHLIWKEMNVPPRNIEFMPWPRAYDMVKTQPGVVLFSMLKTPEREQQFKWFGPIVLSKTVFIAKRSTLHTIKTMDDAKGLTIGVVRDYASAVMLAKHTDIIKLTEHPSLEVALNMLESGRIDLISFEERSFLRDIKELGKDADQYTFLYTYKVAASYYAMSIDTPDSLVRRFQDAYNKVIQTPAYLVLVDQYLQ